MSKTIQVACRVTGLALALASVPFLAGCKGDNDPLNTAAPPPSPNAQQVPAPTIAKRMPGAAAPTALGGGGAAPAAGPTASGPAAKPPGM